MHQRLAVENETGLAENQLKLSWANGDREPDHKDKNEEPAVQEVRPIDLQSSNVCMCICPKYVCTRIVVEIIEIDLISVMHVCGI